MVNLGDAELLITADDKDAQDKMKAVSKSADKMAKNFAIAGAAMVAAGVLIIGMLGKAVAAAVAFEDAFAGVRKTVDATEEEFYLLSRGLRDLSYELPLTAVELARIAEAAGQLGIEKESILSFTKVMAQLGMTTNMTGDEAATTFARFANITGMDTIFFSNLGSVIVALGNNMATTEGEIAAMAMRLAGAGTAIGLTQTQIVALAASLSSVGIQAEAGGTAFSRVMLEMNSAILSGGRKLEVWADIAEMETERFRDLFKTNASDAILAFIVGLGKMKDRGEDLTPVLDEIGLTGIRIMDALLRATGAQELFTEAQVIGEEAWNENNALSDEAQKRLDTVATKMAILKNIVTDLSLTVGDSLLPQLSNLVAMLSEKLKPAIAWLEENPEAIGAFLRLGAVFAVNGMLFLGIAGIVKLIQLQLIPTILRAVLAFIALQAASGPKGWAILAASAGIFAAANIGLQKMMSGFDIGVPEEELPPFKHGGIVPGPRGQPIPIMAHGGEQFAGVGKSIGGVTINVGNFMGDETAMRVFARVIQDALGMDGRRTSFSGINRLGYFPGSSAP